MFRELAFTPTSTGVKIIDIDPINAIQVVNEFTTPGSPYEVALYGNRLFVVDGEGGFRIYLLE